MKLSNRGLVAAMLGAFVVAGCQPALKSQLPTGAAAYEAIGSDRQPATPAGPYVLRAGDKVAVNVYQEQELTQPELTIDEAGMLSLPLIGEVHAAGRSAADLAADIQQAYGRRFLRNPQVSVALREARVRNFTVEGEVTRPGQFAFEPGNTLLTAVAMAGSPTREASLNEVLVFRNVNGERMGGRFDLTAIRAGRMSDPQILPGDVIVVGLSSLRGVYRDFLQASPLLGLFTVF